MIKFFRKIRQQLIGDSKFSKYFIYAIGEILLVVIGILVALQINNWKEQAKLEQLQIGYLKRLVIDLDNDLENIDYVQKEIAANQVVLTEFVKAMNTPQEPEQLEKKMTAFFEQGWLISEFVPSANTYTDLSQTGNMKVIQNPNLVNDIIRYYGYMEQIKNSNNVNKSWITPIDQEVAIVTPAFEIDPNTSILFSMNDRSQAIRKLLQQKDLMGRDAAGHYWINNSLKGNLEAIKGLTEDLKQDLIEELKQYGE